MIEYLLDVIASAGLAVNNLFQLADGQWQANLRDGEGVPWSWGRGVTAEEALRGALQGKPTGASPKAPSKSLDEMGF